jgi:NTP pyrophosphatase (non-canonical NTP hydrolase)
MTDNLDFTFHEYQRSAYLYANPALAPDMALAVWSLGLGGESGEVQEHIKKHLGHGHELDVDAVATELGDVLWYVAALASALGLSLEDIANANLCKLIDRYGGGFSVEKSINR